MKHFELTLTMAETYHVNLLSFSDTCMLVWKVNVPINQEAANFLTHLTPSIHVIVSL